MAASSSSSHLHPIKHDVFISFRGSDTRHGFLSHLTKELQQKQIDAYIDERLESGDEISSTLVKAIEGSMISLIIFSKEYASSKWCLQELEKIIECMEDNNHIIIPVFYNVDPSDVRHQKGTYAEAFAQHEHKLKDNMHKLQIWRSALNKAANLSGYHYSSNFQDESKLIDAIVKDVLDKLDDICPIESKHLVGFGRNLAHVESLMEIESKEVRILGIWGMGGIGKTTLARAIYDKFSSKFESCCFMENVREESKEINGLNYLLQNLFSRLLDQENLNMNDAVKTRSTKRRLQRKKVLIVLDDIDTSEQLEYLIGEQLWLGQGSRVIITSRDKHVLVSRGFHAIHQVEELNFDDALKLFSLNAFNQSLPEIGFEQLSEKVVYYTKGIPLAIKVLGSYLHSRNTDTWESAFRKLHKYPNVQIQNVLKVSYDGLDDIEKQIFLDIAFFFKGNNKDDVIRVLDACGLHAACGIDNLKDKALITISCDNKIQMHDLLQEMGEQIVREESIKDPGRRSRLRDIEEVYDVLKNNMGTDAIEGIMLDMSEIKDVHLNADAFKKMTNLRFLKFYSSCLNNKSNVNLPSDLEPFSNNLRYLHWDRYPLESLPLPFCAEKLVEIHLTHSRVKKLWDGVQDLVNLKIINLRRSEQLMELPDFSMAHNLEKVQLTLCKSLHSVHPSILSNHSLVHLDLDSCYKLYGLRCEIHLKSLAILRVKCSNLKEFSLSSEKITYLDLRNTMIKILHPSIGRFNKIEDLFLNGFNLKSLPINELCCLTSLKQLCLDKYNQVVEKMELHILFDALRSLERLSLNKCNYLCEIPENISALSLLMSLNLNESSVESLPHSIKHLSKLKKISLRKCQRLKSLPELPPCITWLDVEECKSLEIVFSSTCSILKHDYKKNSWFFSFQQCIKLDEQSLCNVMEFTRFSMMQAIHNKCEDAEACYPGSTVPNWFRYKETEKSSFTFELSPASELLGFVCCCILPQFASEEMCKIKIGWRFKCEGNDKSREVILGMFSLYQLNKDHVFLWYLPVKSILPEIGRRGHDDESSNPPKFACEFFAEFVQELVKYPGLIKACGVCPIYVSEIQNIMKTKRLRDIDDDQQQQQLPPTKKFKESCAINDVVDENPHELQPHFQTKISRAYIFHPLQFKFASRMEGNHPKEIQFL